MLIKKFNAWMEEVGVDRLLHFFIAAWLVAEAKIYGVDIAAYTFVGVSILAVVKELKVDEDSDLKDAWASVLGGFLSMVLYVIYDCL